MICAIGKNREIGYKNKLLWKLPKDMKHFVDTTRGKTVIMGQTTYESLYIKPLPNRKNIVLSLDKNLNAPGCETSDNLKEIAERYKDSEEEVFVMGGASIYKQFIAYTEKLYLTLVDDEPLADTFFPDFSNFKMTSQSETQEDNGIKYKFIKLIKNKKD